MGKYYNQFLGKNIDLSPLGLERREDHSPYFCTPKGAGIIGWAGVDGIHYCFIRGFGEMVFAVSPMEIAPNYVRPLARNFEDFLRLLLACKDANFLQQAWQWTEKDFCRALESCVSEQSALDALEQIQKTLRLTPMEEPWTYIKELQDCFDYSKIRYTDEYYDLDMNANAPIPEWAVYYDGTIYGHSGKDRAGTQIPVKKEFQFADRTWLVPAVYSCAKGLVVDFCMRVDLEKFRTFWAKWKDKYDDQLNQRERKLSYLENPLHFAFSPEITVNGKILHRKTGSSVCYIPGDPSEPETRFIAEHYQLDPHYAWSITRACFPWKTGRRPQIKSLELTMAQDPVEIPGEMFEVSYPGEKLDLDIPGHPFTLTVEELVPQILDTSMISPDNMDYPVCYSMLTYTLSPTSEPGTFYVQDLTECDQPRPKQTESTVHSDCEAAALAIIGGADGPTAIIVGAPDTENTLSACSAPHFEPAEKIQWYPVLKVREYEPFQVKLL